MQVKTIHYLSRTLRLRFTPLSMTEKSIDFVLYYTIPMDILHNQKHQIIASAVIAVIILWLLLISSESQIYQIVRTVFGSVFLLFLPGYRLTRVFFAESEIDILERAALSFALSISVIPLLVFYLNLAGIKISAVMVRGVTIWVIAICRGWMTFNWWW